MRHIDFGTGPRELGSRFTNDHQSNQLDNWMNDLWNPIMLAGFLPLVCCWAELPSLILLIFYFPLLFLSYIACCNFVVAIPFGLSCQLAIWRGPRRSKCNRQAAANQTKAKIFITIINTTGAKGILAIDNGSRKFGGCTRGVVSKDFWRTFKGLQRVLSVWYK